MPSLFSRFMQASVLRYPRSALLAVALLTVTMAAGLSNFKIDASADSLTLEHDEALNYYREVAGRYGSSDFLVVTFKPKQGDLFDDENLAILGELRNELAVIKGVEQVVSILDLPLLFSPKVSVGDLSEPLNTLLSEGVDRNAARQEFLTSPLYRNLILSPDGSTTGVLATMALDSHYLKLVGERDGLRLKRDTQGLSASEAIELERVSAEFLDYRTAKAERDKQRVAKVRAMMAPYRERAHIFLGGPDMITADMIDFIRSDLVVFGSGILVFIILTMAAIFRRWRWVVLPLVTCSVTLLTMLGFLAWIDWRLTVISSNFVSLLLIITLALTIHLVVRYRELHSEHSDWDQLRLVSATVSSMALPCLYTVLTTIVAFASLVVSDIRPVIDFGWMMTIGISVALLLTFIIMPAGMMLLGREANIDDSDNSASVTLRFARITEHHGKIVLLASALLAALSGYGISQLQVENRFIDYFRSDTEIYRGMEVIDSALGGTTPLDIIIQAPVFAEVAPFDNSQDPFAVESFDEAPFGEDPFGEDPFGEDPFADSSSEQALVDTYWFTRAGLEDLDKLHTFLESQSEIGVVTSLATLKRVVESLLGHQLNDFEIAFMRKSLSPDIYQQGVAPYLKEELDEARIQLRAMETQGQLKRAELLARIDQFIVEELGYDNGEAQYTGLLVLYNNMLQSLFKSQILTLGAVFIGIVAMFIVLFRSLSISLIAIVPNFLAATIVLGGMGLARIPLDMMTITIAAITVGIGVDHAIHYITRFKREFAVDGDYTATLYRAHASIGRALFYTAITIIIGFSILAFSNFIPSIYFGLLTGLAMIAALFGSMTLLPKLILLFKPFGRGNTP
mgnify:CR=1 FL=1